MTECESVFEVRFDVSAADIRRPPGPKGTDFGLFGHNDLGGECQLSRVVHVS